MAFIGILLYILLNWSYTTAVFTDPGSPTSPSQPSSAYASLPTSEPGSDLPGYSSLTVKSSGGIRFCKKCQAKKPDRTHHCSTCKRCVYKMDHHCPWLATCVGLYNYKAFILFLIYVTLFCWTSFGVSANWAYQEIVVGGKIVESSLMPVHYILLAVLSGVIGLVIGGFTAWHIYLSVRGTTTIESLEKTRYLNPIRKQMAPHIHPERTYIGDAASEPQTITGQLREWGDAITELHANALPGVLRTEEGEERSETPPHRSNAHSALRRNMQHDYESQERDRERDRYNDYLDEMANEKLPHAFDLGWKRNLTAIFGKRPALWFLPICNSLGDGWHWEPSPKWLEAQDKARMERESRLNDQAQQQQRYWIPAESTHLNDPRRMAPPPAMNKADRILGRAPGQYADSGPQSSTPLRRLSPQAKRYVEDEVDSYSTDSDEENDNGSNSHRLGDWNDIPEEMFNSRRERGGRRAQPHR